MKRCVALLLALICLLAGCSRARPQTQESLYEVCEQLMRLLWDVDYQSFTPARMTKFAKSHYEAAFLEYYLQDEAYNAGLTHAQETQLISRLLTIQDRGTEVQVLDGVEYTVQTLKVQVQLERFRPEYPEKNYFEEGNIYDLIYQIYFIWEEDAYKISGFSYLPEDGEMLPAEHRQKLTQQQKDSMLSICNAYLAQRYEVQWDSFSAEEAWAFYTQYLSEAFLERDEITQEALLAQQQLYEGYGVNIRLMKKQLEAGNSKTLVYDGYTSDYYYWVEAEYTYRITAADENFFKESGLTESAEIKEAMYFTLQDDGSLCMVFAEYMQE